MACKYFIDGKQLSEQELKSYVSDKYIDSKDIKFTTLDDIANILAYSNSKIILDGWKVEYSTPLGNKYDTLEEVNNEIRNIVANFNDIDLNNIVINNKKFLLIDRNGKFIKDFDSREDAIIWRDKNIKLKEEDLFYDENIVINPIYDFIEKNKGYEQSKEIIERWKKENNIVYDPEEVYSRGQGFYSAIGAYDSTELELLLQNLIQNLDIVDKAGGMYAVSAFTKPIDTHLMHLEGGSGVNFVIYPQSEDILHAAVTDTSTGGRSKHGENAVDFFVDINKNNGKNKDLYPITFSKYPVSRNLHEIQPNLASIIDERSHHHNELGIKLTPTNFRLEINEAIFTKKRVGSEEYYKVKKLIDNINKILDDKYGKLVKPEIKKEVIKIEDVYELRWKNGNVIGRYNSLEAAKKAQVGEYTDSNGNKISAEEATEIVKGQPIEKIGKQPTQTKENTTSIESVRDKIVGFGLGLSEIRKNNNDEIIEARVKAENPESMDSRLSFQNGKYYLEPYNYSTFGNPDETLEISEDEYNAIVKPKEYTSQALINLKVAALKEVARKYSRSLITSKVVPINPNMVDNSEIQYSKTNNNTEQQTPEDLLTKMIDSGAIQKDCTGGFKAKDGIRGKFTKGSQWEIY